MKTIAVLSFVLSIAVSIACPVAANAASQVDVNNLFVGSPSQGRVAATCCAGGMMQTWTAGARGKLTQIDMYTQAYTNSVPNPAERAIFEVYDAGSFGATALSNIASAILLGSVDMPLNARPNGSAVTAVQSISLSSLNINIQKNQVLAFRMLAVCPSCSTDSYWVNWNVLEGGMNSNSYNGGKYLNPAFGFGNGVYATNDSVDLNFRTFVDASAAVPEPASWTLLIAGFGLLGGTMRRRRGFVTVAG